MNTCVLKKNQISLLDEERQPCEIYTRVMGYHRPVSEFNRGKQGEYEQRKHFIEPATITAEEFLGSLSLINCPEKCCPEKNTEFLYATELNESINF